MKNTTTIIIGIIAVIALVLSLSGPNTKSKTDVAEKVINSGEIRLGYMIYPPLLIKDEKTGELSGISHDIIEAAAQKLNITTNWVEETGWGTAIEGLKTGRYDMVGTQMWPNSARAREAVFSLAPMNSTIFPYVRASDFRFDKDISLLNSSLYTLSALDGEMSIFIAKENYPNAKLVSMPELSAYSDVLLNVTTKKADAVFIEPSVARDFEKSNPGTLRRVPVDPVRVLGNSFAFARGQESMKSMWDIALREMINDGTIANILAKYDASGDYTVNK